MKKGQIAHLDGNRNNNRIENLVFLCLNHHDEYDSQTSQSKNLRREELERYRHELSNRFGTWGTLSRQDELLNFLASQIDLDAMAEAAVKVGKSLLLFGEEHAFDVLVTDRIEYCDGDLYYPHMAALDQYASWGWLTYSYEEMEAEGEMTRVFIEAKRTSVCDKVAACILKRREERGESNERLLNLAQSRGWKEP